MKKLIFLNDGFVFYFDFMFVQINNKISNSNCSFFEVFSGQSLAQL